MRRCLGLQIRLIALTMVPERDQIRGDEKTFPTVQARVNAALGPDLGGVCTHPLCSAMSAVAQ